MSDLVWPLFAAGTLTLLSLLMLLKHPHRVPFDQPNARSLHASPTPRIGGLAMLLGLLPVLSWVAPPGFLPFLLPALALSLLSLADDYLNLPAGLRLLAHGLAAGTFLQFGLDLPLWTNLLLLALLVWMTNLYNFMDGADGLAGGMALFGFGAYGIAASHAGIISLAVICWTISTASLGFLLFNFPPARVFMGDAGSIPLGFLAGALGILGWQQHLWPGWFPLLVFSPFIVDATVTLIRRGLRGEKIWHAHKSHYYQRLVRLGLSHRQLALLNYSLMACLSTSALCALSVDPGWGGRLLAIWAIVYLIIGMTVDSRWRKLHGHEL